MMRGAVGGKDTLPLVDHTKKNRGPLSNPRQTGYTVNKPPNPVVISYSSKAARESCGVATHGMARLGSF